MFGVFLILLIQNRIDFNLPISLKYLTLYVFLLHLSYLFHLVDINYSPNKRDFIAMLSILEILLIYYILKSISFKQKKIYEKIIQIGIIVNIIGIVQFFDVLNLKGIIGTLYGSGNQENWDLYFQYNLRAFSIFNNQPNLLGLFNSFLIIVLFFKGKELISNRVIRGVSYTLAFLGLILSGSLTGILALLVSLSLYFLLFKSKHLLKPLILIVIISLGFYLVFSDLIELVIVRQKLNESIIPSSLLARINGVWLESYNRFIESPIFGIGPSIESLKYSVDNEFFDKFLRYGLIGGALFIGFFIILFRNIWFLIKATSDSNNLRISFVLLISFFVSLGTGSFLKSDKIALIFWMLYFLPLIRESRISRKATPSRKRTLRIFTKNFPRINNPANGVFIEDQAIALSKFHSPVIVYVFVELFQLKSKWPFIHINKEVRVKKEFKEIKVRRVLFIPFPSKTSLYYKSLSISMLLQVIKNRSDIYLINTLIPVGAAFSHFNIPYYLMIHGSDLRNFKPNIRLKKTLLKASKVFCVSDGLSRDVKSIIGDSNEIITINNGLNFSKEIKEQKNTPELFTFLFVGSLIKQKGVTELIQAFETLEIKEKIVLRVVGDGVLKNLILEAKQRLPKNRKIEFFGHVEPSHVEKIMSTSSVLVLPSYKEGFGRVVIEMFREGKPVIVSESGGPEFLVNSSNGLVIKPTDVQMLKSAMEQIYYNFNQYDKDEIYRYAKRNFDNSELTKKLYDEIKK